MIDAFLTFADRLLVTQVASSQDGDQQRDDDDRGVDRGQVGGGAVLDKEVINFGGPWESGVMEDEAVDVGLGVDEESGRCWDGIDEEDS